LLTGKGRCNLTQEEHDAQRFCEVFGREGRFFLSCLSRFSVADTLRFFEGFGVKLKTERGQRIFPASDRASDVLAALKAYMQQNTVQIETTTTVSELYPTSNQEFIIDCGDRQFQSKTCIICTGGLSYPATGCTGDGFTWSRRLGHRVNPLRPALVPLLVKEHWIKALQGLSLRNCRIRVLRNETVAAERFGELLFTDRGLSGPIILDISKLVGELVLEGPVTVSIDLKPALDTRTLDLRIQRDFQQTMNRAFRNSLDALLPRSLIPVIIEQSGISPEKQVHQISRHERTCMVTLIKDLRFTISRLVGYKEAIVTTGGVTLAEIDARTMGSRLVKNLFFAGEVIDLDGPTGGYNLQIAWSTGWVAGEAAAAAVNHPHAHSAAHL